jgi:hypothetical protein
MEGSWPGFRGPRPETACFVGIQSVVSLVASSQFALPPALVLPEAFFVLGNPLNPVW